MSAYTHYDRLTGVYFLDFKLSGKTERLEQVEEFKKLGVNFLLNKTLTSVENDEETIVFRTSCGYVFVLYHEQDCCESVTIESIVGDLQDLVGNPIGMAEEVIGESVYNEYDYSQTYTFYKFATIKGYVDIRWVGESNGYYSESVNTFIGVPVLKS